MFYKLLATVYFGNTISTYTTSFGIFFFSIALIFLFKRVLLNRLKSKALKTTTTFDDKVVLFIEKRIVPVLYCAALYLSIQGLTMSPMIHKTIVVVFLILLTIQCVRAITAIVAIILEHYWTIKEKDPSRRLAFKGMLAGVQIILWGIAIVLLLDNLGFKISTLVAGLGIGGIAIALASQALLGDLFGYVTLFLDRPFEIGDFIIIDQHMGTIEQIGIKSTRIRSLGGELLIFRNTDLTSARVKNYKHMEQRRVIFSFGVTYSTSYDLAKDIPELIRTVIETTPDTQFDRAHFKEFGDSSLVFEIVYYIKSPDYNKYMDRQQEINFAIMLQFKQRGIEFAFPTRTIHIAQGI